MRIKITSISRNLNPFLKVLDKYQFEPSDFELMDKDNISYQIYSEGSITLHSLEDIYTLNDELDKIDIEGITNRGIILGRDWFSKEQNIVIIDGYMD
jgi:hypothetical protein